MNYGMAYSQEDYIAGRSRYCPTYFKQNYINVLFTPIQY